MSDKSDSIGRDAANADGTPKLTLEAQAKLEEVRGQLAIGFTQVVMTMMGTPRYRHLSIADLEWLALEPLLRNCLAMATTKEKPDGTGPVTVGIALWAKVSPEVGKTIEDQVKAGTFPVRLKAADWNSGDVFWLLDVIAPNSTLATNVLVNFGQIAKGAPVHIHPMISRLVDAEILKKLSRSDVSPVS